MSLNLNLGFSWFNLRMNKPSAQKIYEFDDFRLDAGHLMLSHQDEEISLAPKAVKTLLALIESRGEIVSKDDLLDAVWHGAVVEESNLFLYISLLRKALGRQENGNYRIETLRRRGYRFNSNALLVQTMANDGRYLDENGANVETKNGQGETDEEKEDLQRDDQQGIGLLEEDFQQSRRRRRVSDQPGQTGQVPRLGQRPGARSRSRRGEALFGGGLTEPLQDYGTVLVETGVRPKELCNLTVQNAFLHVERPYLLVTDGKTKAARRKVPLSTRAANNLEKRKAKAEGKYIFAGGRVTC